MTLPFGLGLSCAMFSNVATAFSATWRRDEVCGRPVRLTLYIDDYLPMTPGVRAALILATELVYEFTAVIITLNVAKCRLAPATRVKYLGIIINSRTGRFSLPASRVERLRTEVEQLSFLSRNSERFGTCKEDRPISRFTLGCCPILSQGCVSHGKGDGLRSNQGHAPFGLEPAAASPWAWPNGHILDLFTETNSRGVLGRQRPVDNRG